MASFTDFQDGYERTWASLQIRPEKLATVRELAQQLAAGKPRYREIEARTGVPWWFVGLCHYRESAFDFDTYLGNGQTLGRRTTIVPKGRGPFTGRRPSSKGRSTRLRLQLRPDRGRRLERRARSSTGSRASTATATTAGA